MDAQPGTAEGDELDHLTTLIEAYEEETRPNTAAGPDGSDPVSH